jgi:hypothetical protein
MKHSLRSSFILIVVTSFFFIFRLSFERDLTDAVKRRLIGLELKKNSKSLVISLPL